ncbi:hypothetical protein [Hymenobacter rigui]|uniref:hypothetical protein n=1 Tax=Hymenobacter rigui TaxID=334424 RepID=UPI0011CF346D|nr:hypothetical protein [Hymenobacter rigui]
MQFLQENLTFAAEKENRPTTENEVEGDRTVRVQREKEKAAPTQMPPLDSERTHPDTPRFSSSHNPPFLL